MTVVKMSGKKVSRNAQTTDVTDAGSTTPNAAGIVNPYDHVDSSKGPSANDPHAKLRINGIVSTEKPAASLIERWDRQVQAGKKLRSSAFKTDRNGARRFSRSPSSESCQAPWSTLAIDKGISLFSRPARELQGKGIDSPAVAEARDGHLALSGSCFPSEANGKVDEVAHLLVAEALRVARDQPVNCVPTESLAGAVSDASSGSQYKQARESESLAAEVAREEIEAQRKGTKPSKPATRKRSKLCKSTQTFKTFKTKASKKRPAIAEKKSPPRTRMPWSFKRKSWLKAERKAEVVKPPAKRRLLVAMVLIATLAVGVSAFFDRSVDDAKTTAAQSSVAIIRAAIARYHADHGVLPGVRASTGGTCVTGAIAGSGRAGSSRSFVEQLTQFTNQNGQTCSLPGEAFVHDPYLKFETLPDEPFSLSNHLTIVAGADAAAGTQQTSSRGWVYNLDTGAFGPSRHVTWQ